MAHPLLLFSASMKHIFTLMILMASFSNSAIAAECTRPQSNVTESFQELMVNKDALLDFQNCQEILTDFVSGTVAHYCEKNSTPAFAACAKQLFQEARATPEQAASSCLKNSTPAFSSCVTKLRHLEHATSDAIKSCIDYR